MQETINVRSIIDYIIVRNNITFQIIDFRIRRGPEYGIGHKMLIIKIELQQQQTKSLKYTSVETNQ